MESSSMYGLIGKMTAQPGHRDELVRVLIEGVSGLPGCLSYIVALDPLEPEVIWITEACRARKRTARHSRFRRSAMRSREGDR